jgi:hypothetical protein
MEVKLVAVVESVMVAEWGILSFDTPLTHPESQKV